jgi:hypothetical protein
MMLFDAIRKQAMMTKRDIGDDRKKGAATQKTGLRWREQP